MEEYIRNKNEHSGDEYRVVVFDLYDIIIEILKDKGYLEKCYDFEKKKGFAKRFLYIAEKIIRENKNDDLRGFNDNDFVETDENGFSEDDFVRDETEKQ